MTEQDPRTVEEQREESLGDTEDLRVANEDLRTLAETINDARKQAVQHAEELAAINRVTLALTNVTDLQTLLNMVARELTQVFRTRGSTVTLIDESRKTAHVVAEYFHDSTLPSVVGLEVPLHIPAWAQLEAERRAVVIDQPGADSMLGELRDILRERHVSQLLVAPLLARDVLIGNVSVSHEPGRSFAPNEVLVAQTLAGPVAQAVENARLFEAAQRARADAEAMARRLAAANEELERLSLTDALTSIPNRRQFQQVAESEWRRAQRNRTSIGVLMIDVDLFKAYNDNHGHLRGDDCLTRIAGALRRGLPRAGDFVARYGGEEFVVILPCTDAKSAGTVGERLCNLVRDLAIPHGSSSVSPIVTVSIGCSAILPAIGSAAEELIAAADRALYEAKREGRNRVVVAE